MMFGGVEGLFVAVVWIYALCCFYFYVSGVREEFMWRFYVGVRLGMKMGVIVCERVGERFFVSNGDFAACQVVCTLFPFYSRSVILLRLK